VIKTHQTHRDRLETKPEVDELSIHEIAHFNLLGTRQLQRLRLGMPVLLTAKKHGGRGEDG
jgi:hypothetical protein